MNYVYHGSKISGLKKISPHKSTHGNYVYASLDKRVSYIFSCLFGDDTLFAVSRNTKDGPWDLTERFPGIFSIIFNTSSSIYTLNADSFKDIHTGFCELVSEEEVDIVEEENVANLFDKINELSNNGLIKIYNYPNRPNNIPEDDTDLVYKEIKAAYRKNRVIDKSTFARLLFLHPHLLSFVNEIALSYDSDFKLITLDDLRYIFKKYYDKYKNDDNMSKILTNLVNIYQENYPNIIDGIIDNEWRKGNV